MRALPAVQEFLSAAQKTDTRFDTTLDAASEVEGKLVCNGPASIAGKVTGTIIAKGILVIEKGAIVEAQITAEQVIIHGHVDGKLTANISVYLTECAVFKGELHAPNVQMEKGARFDGKSFMSGMVRAADPDKDESVTSPVHKLHDHLEEFMDGTASAQSGK